MDIISENLKQKYNTVLTILSNSEYETVPNRIIFDTCTDYIIKNKNLIKNLPNYPEFNKEYFEKKSQIKTTSQDMIILARCIQICRYFNKELAEYDITSMRNIRLKTDIHLNYIDIITKKDEYDEKNDTSYRIPLNIYLNNGLLKEKQLTDEIQNILDTIKLGAELA